MYEYKTAEIPRNVFVANRKAENVAATALAKVISQHVTDDWEFYRVDTFSVERPGGCLSSGNTVQTYNVATFRRRIR